MPSIEHLSLSATRSQAPLQLTHFLLNNAAMYLLMSENFFCFPGPLIWIQKEGSLGWINTFFKDFKSCNSTDCQQYSNPLSTLVSRISIQDGRIVWHKNLRQYVMRVQHLYHHNEMKLFLKKKLYFLVFTWYYVHKLSLSITSIMDCQLLRQKLVK